MTPDERLSEVFRNARNISFEYTDKIILFSDCHRGDNSWADDFAPNQNVLFHALEHYYSEGFTFIELGDGDELWENRNFTDIRNTHSHIFWIMQQFYKENRLHLIYGNHDMERKDPAIVRKTLHEYYDERSGTVLPSSTGSMSSRALPCATGAAGGASYWHTGIRPIRLTISNGKLGASLSAISGATCSCWALRIHQPSQEF